MDFKNTPPWKSIKIPTASLPRTLHKLKAVVKDLDVENSARYRPNAYGTYCNIFATDVLDAFGVAPSHWVTDDGKPAPTGKGRELNANGMVEWFHDHGEEYGWVPADKLDAMDAAERGHLVLVMWHSGGTSPGHIAVMLPEGTIAQAGRKNFVGGTIREGFGSLPVEFWVQTHGGSHDK